MKSKKHTKLHEWQCKIQNGEEERKLYVAIWENGCVRGYAIGRLHGALIGGIFSALVVGFIYFS